jgi:uncharacterized protein YndB with AHSA1/START domain
MTATLADETTLVLTRHFAAPPEAVFDAWMDHAEFQAWIGPEGVACDVPVHEPHVGGRYRIDMRMSDGRMTPVGGVFKAIERPGRIVLTWGWDGDPERQSLITLTFDAADGGTEFTLRQEGLGTVANRDDHNRGWSSALGKLERHLARR